MDKRNYGEYANVTCSDISSEAYDNLLRAVTARFSKTIKEAESESSFARKAELYLKLEKLENLVNSLEAKGDIFNVSTVEYKDENLYHTFGWGMSTVGTNKQASINEFIAGLTMYFESQ